MTFKQVVSLWFRTGMKVWNEMESIEKYIFIGLIASTLLLVITFFRTL